MNNVAEYMVIIHPAALFFIEFFQLIAFVIVVLAVLNYAKR